MKLTFFLLSVLLFSISVFSQKVYFVKTNTFSNISAIHSSEITCGAITTKLSNLQDLSSFYPISDNEFLVSYKKDGSDGLYHWNTTTNISTKISNAEDVRHSLIIKLKPSGEYLAFDMYNGKSLRISANLTTKTEFLNYTIADATVIQPVNNRTFIASNTTNPSSQVTEFNTSNNNLDLRVNNFSPYGYLYQINNFVDIGNNQLLIHYGSETPQGTNPTKANHFFKIYNYQTNTTVAIDSIYGGTEKNTALLYAKIAYVGNNKLVIMNNTGGVNNLGSVHEYDLNTKSIKKLNDLVSEFQQIVGEYGSNPPFVHDGDHFFGTVKNEVVTEYISGIEINNSLSQPVTCESDDFQSYSQFNCPSCFYRGTSNIEVEHISQFTIYPNPSNASVSITGNITCTEYVLLYNIAGKVVLKQVPYYDKAIDSFQLDVSKLEAGTYFVKIGNYTEKLIVE